tara:strand:+ start:431 stop:769 length:339 start_codon:yes stop_codon:yes gene_type:complete
MFNYLTHTTNVIHETNRSTKHNTNNSKYKKLKSINVRKSKKQINQIVQPGGRSKSNRWDQHTSNTINTAIINSSINNGATSGENILAQPIPNENTWNSKLHSITSNFTLQTW